MTGTLQVVVGAQFGSEGKGAIAGYLSTQVPGEMTAVRVAGPNAGHTVYGRCPGQLRDGSWCTEADHLPNTGVAGGGNGLHPWKLRSVPVAAVTNETAELVIAAGSEVAFDVLEDEVEELDHAGYNASGRLQIDWSATVLTDHHVRQELRDQLTDRIGSTGKGIGAARADRIWRQAEIVGGIFDAAEELYSRLDRGQTVQIEGTQGYGLGLHAGYYPQCTSSDCRAIDFLGMAGVSPWHANIGRIEVWVVARTYPIRVAGNSGPLLNETTWEALNLPVERTTVTNKVRRVGGWDPDLVRSAIEANGGIHRVRLAITMLDQVDPTIHGATRYDQLSARAKEWLQGINDDLGIYPSVVGTGPTTVVDLRPGH